MEGLLNQASLMPDSVRQIRNPKAPKSAESMTTIEVSRGAGARLSEDRMTLDSHKLKKVLPFYYLRDMCKCPQCVDPHSKQRSFRTSDISKDISPRHVKWDGEQLEVKWYNDIPGYGEEHTSQWDSKYLHTPIIDTHDTTSRRMRPHRWSGPMMNKMQHWVSYEDYMNNDGKFTAAMRNLSRLGLIFIKDVPESREMVEKIATRMGPLRNSFYGSTWDVKTVPQAKNVAYTNQFLGFHMDLMYMNEPPGYQLLHCLENSCEGGESLFADTFRVANIMKQHWPQEWEILTKRRLGYEYVHEDSIYHNKWPLFELDNRTGDLRHVNYSPPFQSALPEWTDKEGKNIRRYALFQRALSRFADFLQQKNSIFELKLNPGECVIFANRRVVHARNQFNTTNGSRWLAGAYVDEDALLSRFAVCAKKNWLAWNASDPVRDAAKFKLELAAEGAKRPQRESSGVQESETLSDGAEMKDSSADVESELAEELGQAKGRA